MKGSVGFEWSQLQAAGVNYCNSVFAMEGWSGGTRVKEKKEAGLVFAVRERAITSAERGGG